MSDFGRHGDDRGTSPARVGKPVLTWLHTMPPPPFQGFFSVQNPWQPAPGQGPPMSAQHGPHTHATPGTAPAQHAPVAVATLQAPLWGPQHGETTAEHTAFARWLMGGYEYAAPVGYHGASARPAELRTRGDWPAALGALGCTRAELEQLARRWSWQLRGNEYWTSVRAIGEASVKSAEVDALEFATLARQLDRKWLELELLEINKAINSARQLTPVPGQENAPEFLPRLFTNRELIALRRADGALEVQRYRAGLLERPGVLVDESERPDWEKLGAIDLEAYRLLREKARK